MSTYAVANGKTLDEAFAEFHEKNPHVYDIMLRIIHFLRDKGYTKFSMHTVSERMRWVAEFETTPVLAEDEVFKFNDAYSSRYARLLMKQEPELEGFFDIRRLRS